MKATLLTPVLIILIALFVFIGAMRGRKRGAVRSAINLAVLVASAFLGAGLAILLSKLLYDPACSMLEGFGVMRSLDGFLGSFSIVIYVVVGMLATLLCFLPCFLVIYILLSLLIRIILAAKAGGAGQREEFASEDDDLLVKRDKRIGALIGVASALFVSVAVLGPITGVLKATSDTVEIVSNVGKTDVSDMAPVVKDIVKYSDDSMVTVVSACGGRMWFNMATTTYCYGNFTNLNKEIRLVEDIGTKDMPRILKSVGKLDEKSVKTFEDFIKKTEKSPVMKTVLKVAVNEASAAWLNGEEYKKVARPAIGNEHVNGFIDDVLYLLTGSEIETVGDDVTTLLNLTSILREYESIFSSDNYAEMADVFSEGKLADKLKAEIRKNKRMLLLEGSINQILMKTFAEEISDFDKFTVEQRSELYDQLADILTSSVGLNGTGRINMVATDIAEAFESYGVYAPGGMTNEIAAMLVTELCSGKSRISADDVSDYFDKYLGVTDPAA